MGKACNKCTDVWTYKQALSHGPKDWYIKNPEIITIKLKDE